MGHWRVKTQSGDNFRMINTKTGEIRDTKRDKAGIKRGDYLQPNIEKDKFIQKYGHHPQESKEDIARYLSRRGIKIEPKSHEGY